MRGAATAKSLLSGAGPLLSGPGQLLYARLVRAFPGHVILAHVALSRMLPAQARPGRLVAQFVVCKADFTPLAAFDFIERADSSADLAGSRRKDLLLQAAGIKVIRLPPEDIPPEVALKSLAAALPLRASAAEPLRRAS